MATYSPNLAITLPADGEFSGTWGQITNTNLGTLLEEAVSGYTTQSMLPAADVTLTMSNGASSTARNMYIQCTGSMSQNNNLIVPNNKKLYFIYNNTSYTTTPYSVTVKTAAGSGITVPNGAKMLLVCDGSSIVDAVNYFNFSSLSLTTLTVSGNATAAAFIPSGASVPTNGVYLPSANTLGFATNSLTRGNINATGAWTWVAPTSGNHIINLLAGSNGIAFTTGSHTVNLYSDGSTQYLFGTSTNIPFKFLCNNVVVGTIATTGGWSIAAPTSGVAFTVNGIAGTHSTQIADNNNSKFDAGYLGIPQNAQTALYSPTLQDRGKHIRLTLGSALTPAMTVSDTPYAYGTTAPTTPGWTAGDSFVVVNNSAFTQRIDPLNGNVTFRLAGTASTGNRFVAQYGVATFLCIVGGATPTFVVSGAGVS